MTTLVLFATLLVLTVPSHGTDSQLETPERLAAAVARAQLPFSDPSRLVFRRTPGPRPGVRLGELTVDERASVDRLLRSALSKRGYERVIAILRQDDILKPLRPSEALGSDAYYFAVYGVPGPSEWAWRLEGHHLSIRTSYGRGRAVTPLVLGMEEPEGGQLPLPDRESKILALIATMSPANRAAAAAGSPAPMEPLIAEREPGFTAPRGGLSLAALPEAQRALAWDVIRDFVEDVHAEVAADALARLRKAHGELSLAVSGAPIRGGRLYFRIAGPDDLFEYQNIGRHIHSVWRNRFDFGQGERPRGGTVRLTVAAVP